MHENKIKGNPKEGIYRSYALAKEFAPVTYAVWRRATTRIAP